MDTLVLKNKLLEVGYDDNQVTDDTISRLLNLSGKPKDMLMEWIESAKSPIFEPIEGVNDTFLREKLQMKDPAIIIAYAMMIESPSENASYFKHLSENIIGFYPNL